MCLRQLYHQFVNTYTATDGAIIIKGVKTLTGRNLVDGEFSFTLYNASEEWVGDTAVQTVYNGADGTFAFDEMTFDEVGTYYYLVKEDKGNLAGVTYDETVYRVKVEVTDDLNGKLVVSCTVYDETNTEKTAIEFVNTYAVANPDTGDNVLTWLIPVVASGVVLTALTLRKKKNDNEDEE